MVNAQEQQPRITTNRRQGQNHFFVEDLPGGLALQMMQIPAGTFLMGSPEDELERTPAEGPQHEVSVPAFFMGKYPVTQEQWQFVVTLPLIRRVLKPNPSHFKGNYLYPVESISWFEAVEFCDRLSAHTGRPYRLPSEAEWEYACRAGTTTPFHLGETITTDLANYNGTDGRNGKPSGSYGSGPKGSYRQTTTPVNEFGIANSFGLCDMHGNVREWCQDDWHDSYKGAPIDGSVWTNTSDELRSYKDVSQRRSLRVIRGGSWRHNPGSCRSAYRDGDVADGSFNSFGLRVVCSMAVTFP